MCELQTRVKSKRFLLSRPSGPEIPISPNFGDFLSSAKRAGCPYTHGLDQEAPSARAGARREDRFSWEASPGVRDSVQSRTSPFGQRRRIPEFHGHRRSFAILHGSLSTSGHIHRPGTRNQLPSRLAAFFSALCGLERLVRACVAVSLAHHGSRMPTISAGLPSDYMFVSTYGVSPDSAALRYLAQKTF